MTVDCLPTVVDELRAMLDREVAGGVVRYGIHTQNTALITCVAPSVLASDHMHFIDGADGGYAEAAKQLEG